MDKKMNWSAAFAETKREASLKSDSRDDEGVE